MREKEFLKSVIDNRNSVVYIWFLVASWGCEVTVILPPPPPPPAWSQHSRAFGALKF